MVALVSMARLSAIGSSGARCAAGRTLRRINTSAWCDAFRSWLEEQFREIWQYGVAVSGGVEQVGLWVRLHQEVGRWLISLDAAHAFNSVSRAAIFGVDNRL